MKRACIVILTILAVALLAGCGPLREYNSSRNAEALFAQGWDALWQQDNEQAFTLFHEAAELRPAADLLARIGLAYHLQGRCREALPWLQKAFETQPRQPWAATVALAAGYASSGQPSRARPLIQRALLHLPDDPMLLNNIAYPMADANVLAAEAAVILEEAVRQDPHSGIILDSLGWAYFRQGRTEEALLILQKAIALSPDPEIRRHLTAALQALKPSPGSPQREGTR